MHFEQCRSRMKRRVVTVQSGRESRGTKIIARKIARSKIEDTALPERLLASYPVLITIA